VSFQRRRTRREVITVITGGPRRRVPPPVSVHDLGAGHGHRLVGAVALNVACREAFVRFDRVARDVTRPGHEWDSSGGTLGVRRHALARANLRLVKRSTQTR